MKKLISLALALVIVLSTSLVVFASSAEKADTKYTEEQLEIIDELYNFITKNDKDVVISKNDIWCSEKSALNIYLLVGKAKYSLSDVYFEALYEVNGETYIIYSLQSTLCGLLNSETEVNEKVKSPNNAEFTLKMIAFYAAKNLFPKAEVGDFVCIRVRGVGYYILTGTIELDGETHIMTISFEFKGDGYEYVEENFHLFEATLDGELMFEEERIFG